MVAIPRIVITGGEPAGIGPDIIIQLASRNAPCELVAVADPKLLQERARQLRVPLTINLCELTSAPKPHKPYHLSVVPVSLEKPVTPGTLDVANVPYVLNTIQTAADICIRGQAAGMVTAPIHKGIVISSGKPFSGHTEFLRDYSQAQHVVMLLATHDLRVALTTTHIPLADVPAAITPELLEKTLRILHLDMRKWYKIADPTIFVLGLNPHAGENGYLGREEIDIINPTLDKLRKVGMRLVGCVSADTAFTQKNLQRADAFLTMYHDQGLPVLKAVGFGEAVNITLGLPFIRTSVDHGTALDIAGTGNANVSSLRSAVNMAVEMAMRV
ncbi:MAG: 4-hydroxythreonine-4-phosphate dehydrogenase [marine bacterium B5-7]|nr:MAG: 4-hydroxythreonine-4-phosphate dehydrogenase [marine bacterium B5-7]